MAKILVYDLETTPHLIEAWGTYQTDALKVVRESYILCFAYKWLGEKKTHVVMLPDFKTHYKRYPEDDTKVVQELHRLFDEADVLIAHNGDRFDQKKTLARFAKHDMLPPSPYRSIDTLKVARGSFAFPSNRLDALGDFLGVGRKVAHTGKKLWFDCMAGDMKAWKLMKKYNIQDVKLLEDVYYKLRPYIKNSVNLAEGFACTNCSGYNLQRRGFQKTNSYTYQRYRCMDCGKWLRRRKAEKELGKSDLVSI